MLLSLEYSYSLAGIQTPSPYGHMMDEAFIGYIHMTEMASGQMSSTSSTHDATSLMEYTGVLMSLSVVVSLDTLGGS